MKKTLVGLSFLVFFMFICSVFAVPDGEEVDLTHLPNQLAEALGIDIFSARLLTSVILISFVVFVALFCARSFDFSLMYAVLFTGFPMSGFCVALGWLPVWLFLIVCVVVALMFSGQMRGLLTGRGE